MNKSRFSEQQMGRILLPWAMDALREVKRNHPTDGFGLERIERR